MGCLAITDPCTHRAIYRILSDVEVALRLVFHPACHTCHLREYLRAETPHILPEHDLVEAMVIMYGRIKASVLKVVTIWVVVYSTLDGAV